MNSHLKSHLFWGVNAPLSSLIGAELLIIASGRISSALLCTASLVWAGGFTMLAAGLGRKVLPAQAEDPVLIFLSALASGIFYVVLSLLNPVFAMESAFFIVLSSAFVISSGLYRRVKNYDTPDILLRAVSEALVLGGLILALALIREALGYGALSLPVLGMFRFVKEEPLRLLQASSGALILLGYGAAVYRYVRNRYTNSEDD